MKTIDCERSSDSIAYSQDCSIARSAVECNRIPIFPWPVEREVKSKRNEKWRRAKSENKVKCEKGHLLLYFFLLVN